MLPAGATECIADYCRRLDRTVGRNPFIPHRPFPRQAIFLGTTALEAMFGGAAGGGKSDALLMAALQYADVPGYSALLIRKTFADLNKPDSLIPRSHEWLGGKAQWRGANRMWVFPSGAVLAFGYLETRQDVYQYQSAAYQFIGFDELTQFREWEYRYMFSRLRKGQGMEGVPIRMRSGTNPGGIGHDWVKQRFVNRKSEDDPRVFVRSRLNDNPFLDQEQYRDALSQLPTVERLRLENGDWDVQPDGGLFKADWFRIVPKAPPDIVRWCRYWDLACTPPGRGDPDMTAGVLVGLLDGVWYVTDVDAFLGTAATIEARVKACAERDPPGTLIGMEEEGGASGKIVTDHYARRVLAGYRFRSVRATMNKMLRLAPLASAAERGNVRLVDGPWVDSYVSELIGISGTGEEHDDRADATSGGMQLLSNTVRLDPDKMHYDRGQFRPSQLQQTTRS